MEVEFKIRITKEVIEHCKYCGAENNEHELNRNCAVAIALKDIFPDVYVTNYYIFPFGIDTEERGNIKITMPLIAQQFIKLFDGFCLTPNLRLLLPEFEFVINIPDEAIDHINIAEIKDFVNESKTRRLIQISSL